MTDRVALKDKINSSGKSINIETGRHSSHRQYHRKSSSQQQKDASSKTQDENFVAGDTFNKRYKVIEKIGEGSYSEVLKCQNRLEGTVVACKRLKHIYKSLEDVTNISEIATLRSIQKHSNILQMIEIHYDKSLGKVSLVFELMDINLYELIKDRKRLLPESRVRTILFQLFKALRHLHKLGVFHRDIKPENILIKAKTDQLKLGDLGSVRGMFSRPPYTEYISTRWYRSPECLLSAGHYSHKMDIWAAGCVFYEVLTLRPLFPGSSEIDQINRINNVLGPPPPKLLDTFQKQAELERETYRGQSQLARRQQIQKVLNGYSSRYMAVNDSSSKSVSNNSSNYRKNSTEFHFAGKEGTGLEKILPTHITREAKDLIKSCLLYDPELRPTAQRIVQLPYFSELRENHSKNAEKVSSKSVVLICGDTVTDQCTPIELSTLGDHKIRYKRGITQKSTVPKGSASKGSASTVLAEKKSALAKSTDINNNNIRHRSRRQSSSFTEDMALVTKPSRSRLSSVARSSGSQLKVPQLNNKLQESKRRERISSSIAKPSSSNRPIIMNGVSEQSENHQGQSTKRVRGRSKCGKDSKRQEQQGLTESQIKQLSQTRYSTTSFEGEQSPQKKERKNERRNQSKAPSENGPRSTIVAAQDISLSPYVKPPSELKFLRNKMKNVPSSRSKLVPPLGQVTLSGNPKLGHVDQQTTRTRVAVVPPKVAAAAIKYAKANSRNVRGDHIAMLKSNLLDRAEGSGTTIVVGSGRAELSATDDTTSYATASSVKIGKLRFRQAFKDVNNQQQNCKPLEDNPPSVTPSYIHLSKIPVLVHGTTEVSKSWKNTSKILSSPEQCRESDTTDKWRNTGIPRILMSPERERSIKLLKESLTLDRNKKLKLRYRQQQQQQQDEQKNNSSRAHHSTRRAVVSKSSLNYVSPQDTLQSIGEQQQGTYSSAGGKCRNSTTDYENPDVQDTSSASAAAFENQQRSIFNLNSRNSRIAVPPLESVMNKQVPAKKSSELYPPEMLRLYSSRYRGPDINMNILKDSANSYIKQGQPENMSQVVKEKLNRKFEQRGQRQVSGTLSSQQIGDQPSKIISERSSYGHYSSSLMGAGEEEQFTRIGIAGASKMERRPPLPPLEGSGRGNCRDRNQSGGFRDASPEASQQYGYFYGQKAALVPMPGRGKRTSARTFRESVQNLKEKNEPLRSTMRDDVFCSSDDDVVISMRKKFDSLISERAKKLSESLKSNGNSFASESMRKKSPPRRVHDSDEDISLVNRRLRSNAASDKSRKHARRELRARMAESLTANNYQFGDDKWRIPVLPEKKPNLPESRASKDNGDWMFATPKFTDKLGDRVKVACEEDNNNDSSCNPPLVLRRHKNNTNADGETQSGLKYGPTKRIHPFPVQEERAYRRGQIFTPPVGKQSYPSPQLGTILYDRQLRYTHNNPMAISRDYKANNPARHVKDVDIMKKHQRV